MSVDSKIDIAEKLGDFDHYGLTATERSTMRLEAWQEIQKLRAEVERISRNRDMWKGQVERQAAQLMEMRAALHPFAEMADVCDYFDRGDERTLCTFVRDGIRHKGPTAGDCRKAKAVLDVASPLVPQQGKSHDG